MSEQHLSVHLPEYNNIKVIERLNIPFTANSRQLRVTKA